MRLAMWNLDRCRPSSARADRLREAMHHVDADVWVLTETWIGLSPGSSYRLLSHSADAPDRQSENGECWVAIWSRTSGGPVDLTEDLERVAGAKIGDTVVVGTVLPWLSDQRDSQLRGEAVFRARLRDQAADWQRLRSTAGGLCVAGDFNQDLLPTGHYYGSKGGRDALKAALIECQLECLTSDADDPLADGSGLANIDHICVGSLLTRGVPRSSAWPPVGRLEGGLTDHYCIYAEIEQA